MAAIYEYGVLYTISFDCVNFVATSRGCLTQEKIVASCAKQFVIIADDRYIN